MIKSSWQRSREGERDDKVGKERPKYFNFKIKVTEENLEIKNEFKINCIKNNTTMEEEMIKLMKEYNIKDPD